MYVRMYVYICASIISFMNYCYLARIPRIIGGCCRFIAGRRDRDQQLNYNLVSVSRGHISLCDIAFAETDFETRY